MNKKKDILEELEHYPEGIELNEDLIKRAQELTSELYGPNGKRCKRKNIFRMATAAVLSCCLVLCICLPICFSNLNVPKTYLSADLRYESIDNISSFVANNDLNACYLTGTLPDVIIENTAYYIKENDQLAYLKQSAIYLPTEHLPTAEMIDLGICFSDNEFEEFKEYNLFDSNVTIVNILIEYKQTMANSINVVYAKFAYQEIIYYLQIQTTNTIEDRLEYYVNLLLN